MNLELDKHLAKGDGTTLKQHNDDLQHCLGVIKDMGYIRDEHLYALIKIACNYHDYGKVNAEFQKRVRSGGKVKFKENEEVAHNVLSVFFINPEDFEDYEDYIRVAFAVAFHHNYCDVISVLKSNEKRGLIKSLLSPFDPYKVKTIALTKIFLQIMSDRESILLKGFLHKCDHCASAGCIPELKNDFLQEKVEALGYQWKDMQRYCQDNGDENIIVVAQTGMGKTEGALKWIGNNKGFLVLPLKTAINAMYDRIRDNIIKEDSENRLAILHSESISHLLEREDKDSVDLMDYNQRARKLSMPLTVTTVDQLFDFVFRYNGYEMKLTTFSYSKIVIDEIQMYGAELLAYLIYGIKKIIEFGGKVAIVTATLPPFIRDLLGEGFKYREFTDNSLIRHNISVRDEEINPEDIIEKYEENLTKTRSNKILVICNTIKKAQELYEEISKRLGNKDCLHLFHTRFTKMDRASKEKKIISVGATDEPMNEIWITTSVVEASLDIDFDYLFTELQDLNSLFQRLGRCNRKGKKPVNEYNCFVYTDIDPKIIRFKNGKTGFIDETIFSLSKAALAEVDGILTEDEKLRLLNTYFTSDNLKDGDFLQEYNKYYRRLDILKPYSVELKDIELRHINTKTIIPKCVYEDNKEFVEDLVLKIEGAERTIERVKLMDEMANYTVDIPVYQFAFEAVQRSIKIGSKVYCYVMECIYDSKIGFKACKASDD